MGVDRLSAHIEITPGVLGGKPRIAGRRIGVAFVAMLHDRSGWSADEIAHEYDLTLADVYAALAYYFDHREEIDARSRADQEFVRTKQTDYVSKLPTRQ